MILQDLRDLIGEAIPNDHSHQVVSEYYVHFLFERHSDIQTVLDLGCGAGNSIDLFRKKNRGIRWIGLDIVSRPEAVERTRAKVEFYTYDGVNIPFDDNYFDLIYCNQVFEHVRNPKELLREVYRVLKPGHFFIGSTSQLEPYHSYSLWNYTIYGFLLLLNEAQLQLIEIRPSIDALTLIIRKGLRYPKFFRIFWTRESPLNMIIGIAGKMMRRNNASINLVKLVFCGQFCFLVRKVE